MNNNSTFHSLQQFCLFECYKNIIKELKVYNNYNSLQIEPNSVTKWLKYVLKPSDWWVIVVYTDISDQFLL